jgi:hypothetical protein
MKRMTLWGVSLLETLESSDRSTLVSRSFSYSARDEATIAGGAFFELGDDGIDLSRGVALRVRGRGPTVYLSVSIFF